MEGRSSRRWARGAAGYPTQKPGGSAAQLRAGRSRQGGWCLDCSRGRGRSGGGSHSCGRRYVPVDSSPRRSRSGDRIRERLSRLRQRGLGRGSSRGRTNQQAQEGTPGLTIARVGSSAEQRSGVGGRSGLAGDHGADTQHERAADMEEVAAGPEASPAPRWPPILPLAPGCSATGTRSANPTPMFKQDRGADRQAVVAAPRRPGRGAGGTARRGDEARSRRAQPLGADRPGARRRARPEGDYQARREEGGAPWQRPDQPSPTGGNSVATNGKSE